MSGTWTLAREAAIGAVLTLAAMTPVLALAVIAGRRRDRKGGRDE